jgi:hypothetical protein
MRRVLRQTSHMVIQTVAAFAFGAIVLIGCTTAAEIPQASHQEPTTPAPDGSAVSPAPTSTGPSDVIHEPAPALTTTPHPTTTSSVAETWQREVVQVMVRSRDSWGARPPSVELTPHEIDTITIHHTGRSQDETPMDERLRRWQDYHQSIGFGDIAYHLIIAADGTVYEGRDYRSVGATRTSYDPSGHLLPVLDGMFDEQWDNPNDDDDVPDGADVLSDAQLASLVDVLVWGSVSFGIDPASISGHRDHAATACPGSVVHELIHSGTLARLVQERIAAVDIELTITSE